MPCKALPRPQTRGQPSRVCGRGNAWRRREFQGRRSAAHEVKHWLIVLAPAGPSAVWSPSQPEVLQVGSSMMLELPQVRWYLTALVVHPFDFLVIHIRDLGSGWSSMPCHTQVLQPGEVGEPLEMNLSCLRFAG